MEQKQCGCLFCNSKCPECGSESISVEFTVKYEFANSSKDSIHVSQTEDMIELQCDHCGSDFGESDFYGDDDPRIEPLRLALFKALDLTANCTLKCKDGEIRSEQFVMKSE